MATATSRQAPPGERFYGVSGVVILQGIKPDSAQTKPQDVEKDSREGDK